mgnify:CR=1 FL=1
MTGRRVLGIGRRRVVGGVSAVCVLLCLLCLVDGFVGFDGAWGIVPGSTGGCAAGGPWFATLTYRESAGAAKAQLNNVTVRVSLSTRAACIGANGAGKSTMIKLMVGEIEPNEGEGEPSIVRHPNMRLAYVAQHAFHHIENHLELTPTQYIELSLIHI